MAPECLALCPIQALSLQTGWRPFHGRMMRWRAAVRVSGIADDARMACAQRILLQLLSLVPQAAAAGEACTPFMELLCWMLGRRPDSQVLPSICSRTSNATMSCLS